MKKSILLVLTALLFTLSAIAFHLIDWSTYSVDDQVTVQLPASPQAIDLAKILASQGKTNLTITDQSTKMYMASDAVGFYQLIRVDMTTTASSSSSAMDRTSYYEGVINGALKPQEGVLLSRSTFSTAGGEGIDIKYRGLHKGTGKRTIKYMRTLLVGKVGYTLNFVARDQQDTTGTSGSAQRQQFFQSLTVKSAPGK